MLTKKKLLNEILDLSTELNMLYSRIEKLERNSCSTKKVETAKQKRGRGRPRKDSK